MNSTSMNRSDECIACGVFLDSKPTPKWCGKCRESKSSSFVCVATCRKQFMETGDRSGRMFGQNQRAQRESLWFNPSRPAVLQKDHAPSKWENSPPWVWGGAARLAFWLPLPPIPLPWWEYPGHWVRSFGGRHYVLAGSIEIRFGSWQKMPMSKLGSKMRRQSSISWFETCLAERDRESIKRRQYIELLWSIPHKAVFLARESLISLEKSLGEKRFFVCSFHSIWWQQKVLCRRGFGSSVFLRGSTGLVRFPFVLWRTRPCTVWSYTDSYSTEYCLLFPIQVRIKGGLWEYVKVDCITVSGLVHLQCIIAWQQESRNLSKFQYLFFYEYRKPNG